MTPEQKKRVKAELVRRVSLIMQAPPDQSEIPHDKWRVTQDRNIVSLFVRSPEGHVVCFSVKISETY